MSGEAMRHCALILTVLCAATSSVIAAPRPVAFKSESLNFPENVEPVSSGPGGDAVNNNCLSCHSREMILNQPPLTRAQWAGEIDKMRHAFKAPISDADAARILDYLSTTRK
jgi:hypothetical protein